MSNLPEFSEILAYLYQNVKPYFPFYQSSIKSLEALFFKGFPPKLLLFLEKGC